MSHLSKRAFAPLAVLALAAPVLAPAVADAAIGGALAPTSTLAPDLISANVTTVTATSTTVHICYNKTLGSTPVPTAFKINTYAQDTVPGTTASATGQCADVTFSGVTDPSTYTTVSAAGSAVVNATTGTPSNADSTALIGTSSTNNGTRGRSTAPDLTGVAVSGTNVAYTFDEAITIAPNASQFTLVNNSGAVVTGGTGGGTTTLSADRKTVTVGFPTLTPVNLATAVRAVYTPGAAPTITALSTNDPTPISAGILPGTNGATTLPDPIQAILVGDTSTGQVDLVFDQAVGAPTAGQFRALLSDGQLVAASAAAVTTTNTVRLTFAGLTNAGEYIVGVEVNSAAVGANTVATVPAGGNTGAFATGFTTGPDAVATTFDGTNNAATITFDQRYFVANAGNFRRVDNTGTVNVSDVPTLSFGSTTTPGRTTIQAGFTSLAGTRALQILNGGVFTSIGYSNIDQILAPSASSAG